MFISLLAQAPHQSQNQILSVLSSVFSEAFASVFISTVIVARNIYILMCQQSSLRITNTNYTRLQFKNVILATTTTTTTTTTTSSTAPTTRQPCPAKDTKCAAPDGSNVIMRMSTEDDADCGG